MALFSPTVSAQMLQVRVAVIGTKMAGRLLLEIVLYWSGLKLNKFLKTFRNSAWNGLNNRRENFTVYIT
jgi:hypothetical protein